MRKLPLLIAYALAGTLISASAASAAPTPSPSPKSFNPIRVPLFSAPAGTTLTLGSHPAVTVSSWSMTTDAATGGSSGRGTADNTPLTVTVPFGATEEFLQQDAAAGKHETKAVLTTPQATFTFSDVLVSSFSVGNSGGQTSAQVTLTFSRESVSVRTGGQVTPCPKTATSTTICFANISPIALQTWNMTTGKSSTQLTFSGNLGTQADTLQLWAVQHKALSCVTLLASGMIYKFDNAKLTSVQLQGTGNSGTASVAMVFQKYEIGAACPTKTSSDSWNT